MEAIEYQYVLYGKQRRYTLSMVRSIGLVRSGKLHIIADSVQRSRLLRGILQYLHRLVSPKKHDRPQCPSIAHFRSTLLYLHANVLCWPDIRALRSSS